MGLSTDDVVAIQQLVARYNFAVDGGDPDAFAGTFTPDGEFGAGGQVMRGHDELRAFVVGRAGIAPRRHLVSSILVDGEGDRASLRAYLQVVAMGDDGALQVAVQGTYDDELVRTADGWRFSRRSFSPDTAPPA
jgi:uncharacterized protein (TIGR02246 family)